MSMRWTNDNYGKALEEYHQLIHNGVPIVIQPPKHEDQASSLLARIRCALGTLTSTIRLFGPSFTFASFNGGKDALVVLHLWRLALAHFYFQHNVPECTRVPPLAVFFRSPSEFFEIEEFIEATTREYGVGLRIYEGSYTESIAACLKQIRQAAENFEEQQQQQQHNTATAASSSQSVSSSRPSPSSSQVSASHPHSINPPRPIAIILGLRRGDTDDCNSQKFEPSSEWLKSSFMRVNPIIDWSYGDVWNFLLGLNLPYCSLYNCGYTSIGTTFNTKANPDLRQSNGSYSPAYKLVDWRNERGGRVEETPQVFSHSRNLSSSWYELNVTTEKR